MDYYLRGQIAKMADIHPETLRYYEQNGLIQFIQRSDTGYRLYPETVLGQLAFIKNAKESGFTLKEIKEMLALTNGRDISFSDMCSAVDEKIQEIDNRISNLNEMRAALVSFKNNEQESISCPHIRAFLNNFNEE